MNLYKFEQSNLFTNFLIMNFQLLKLLLYKSGLGHIKIVVPDAMDWGFVDKLIADPVFLEAIDVIGFVLVCNLFGV